MRKGLILIILGVIVVIPLLAGCSQPTSQAGQGQIVEEASAHLVVILVPGFDFHDCSFWLEGLPKEAQDHLQMAGISMRTGGPLTFLNNMFTLAYGRFKTAPKRWNAYQLSDERIIHPLAQLKGETDVKGKNQEKGKEGPVGAHLKKEGLFTYVLGNSDTLFTLKRTASLLVMDQNGEARGMVDDAVLSPTPYLPGGYRTNWRALTERLEEIWSRERASLTVVELGDLWRLEEAAPSGKLNRAQKQLYRQMWLEEWQDWFQLIASRITESQLSVTVWIVSPFISQEAQREGHLLAPLITWSREQKGGILSSPTTRQYGVVANVDLVPSLLHFFHLAPGKNLYGQPFSLWEEISHQEEGERFAPFMEHIRYLFTIYGTRRMIITVYLSVMIVLLILTALYWWLSKERRGAQLVQGLIGAMLISPVYFLWLTPLIKWVPPLVWIALLLGASMLTSLLFYRLFKTEGLLTGIGLANTVIILVDIWRGSPWMQRSFLGFDPLIGARFYGLGNEYAGILLGSSVLAVTGISVYLSKRSRWKKGGFRGKGRQKLAFFSAVTCFYLLLIYSMAAPQLGTNAGATLAALVTYALSLMFLLRVEMRWFHLLLLFALAGGLLLFLAQLHLEGEKTHISLFLDAVREQNVEWLADVLNRKLTMNWKLIKVSMWGRLFTTALVVMGAVYLGLYRRPVYRLFTGRQRLWMAGFKTLMVGTIVILLANDSGVVAAAATAIYMTFPFLFIHLERRSIIP